MSELQKPTDPFRLSLISAEHRLDIGRREAVIGLRNQKPTEPSLAVRKLGNYHFAAYAAPDCSKGWIGVCVDTRSARWTRSHFSNDILLEVSAPRNALDLARFGHGRVVLPCFIGDREPDLQRIGSPDRGARRRNLARSEQWRPPQDGAQKHYRPASSRCWPKTCQDFGATSLESCLRRDRRSRRFANKPPGSASSRFRNVLFCRTSKPGSIVLLRGSRATTRPLPSRQPPLLR